MKGGFGEGQTSPLVIRTSFLCRVARNLLSPMQSRRSSVFKCVLIGEGGVGKTSIAVRYTEDRFDEHMKMTIGVNFASKKVLVGEDEVTLMLWDLGGQPRFQDVVVDYYRGSRIAIAVYDVTRPYTLHMLDNWIGKLHESVPSCPIVLVANKVDEVDMEGTPSRQEADEFAAKYNALFYMVSAKTGMGVYELFDAVAKFLTDRLSSRV
ncbi:MAG: GTP-binding protein [Candidatus Thorarchaeota archaeon]|nr:GTP-binding protein [Candidatus Thorarchaeota archaeon]